MHNLGVLSKIELDNFCSKHGFDKKLKDELETIVTEIVNKEIKELKKAQKEFITFYDNQSVELRKEIEKRNKDIIEELYDNVFISLRSALEGNDIKDI